MSALTSAAHTHPQAYVFANSAYHTNTLPALVQFLHRACFRPVVDTWCKTIDAGYFATWPGLTSKLLRKHIPTSIETAKGHLRIARQHIRSTRNQPTLTHPPQSIHQPITTEGILHTENSARENLVCMRLVKVSGQICSDQTGRFPIFSSRGDSSVMVLYDYDSNAILTEPLKKNMTLELVRAQKRLTQYLLYRGLKPTALRIDNEYPSP